MISSCGETQPIKSKFLKGEREDTKSTVSSGVDLKYTFDKYSCSFSDPDLETMVQTLSA